MVNLRLDVSTYLTLKSMVVLNCLSVLRLYMTCMSKKQTGQNLLSGEALNNAESLGNFQH